MDNPYKTVAGIELEPPFGLFGSLLAIKVRVGVEGSTEGDGDGEGVADC